MATEWRITGIVIFIVHRIQDFKKYLYQNLVYFELQDGCLSLEEFLTAMHLVVLKRNNIDVPETLPPILKPAYLRQRLTRANRKVTKIIFEKVKQTEMFFFINTHIFIA